MSKLIKELTLMQGVVLLATSLMGSGVFAVPTLVAQIAGNDSLWAWPLLLVLFIPIALTFAMLGSRYPDSGGAAYFVGKAFGDRAGQMTALLFLSVIPVGLPAVLQIAAGFWQPLFSLDHQGLFGVEIGTIGLVALFGLRRATASAHFQLLIALLIILLIIVIGYKGHISWHTLSFPALQRVNVHALNQALSIMFWCFIGIEAFAHLSAEFRHPKRDFTNALIIGLLVTGVVYWAGTVMVLHFHAYRDHIAASAAFPYIVTQLFGPKAQWLVSTIGFLSCFAGINIYVQSFTRLVWSQALQYRPKSWLAQLSPTRVPKNALYVIIACYLLSTLVTYYFALSLDQLIIYANSVFVLIYLLSMLAGVRLLVGRNRLLALLGTLLTLIMLAMLGWATLYALAIAMIAWGILTLMSRKH